MVTESHGMSPVGSLYYVYLKNSLGLATKRIDGNPIAKATILDDFTCRLSANPKGKLLYRFAPAPNLVTLLFVGENGN